MNNKRRHHHNNGKNRNRQRFQPERPSINKVYDSNGPTGRQRGTASTLYEKYVTLARDAHSSGDRVLSENLMQHAEHYLRIVNSIQEQLQMTYRDSYQENNNQNVSEDNEGEEANNGHHLNHANLSTSSNTYSQDDDNVHSHNAPKDYSSSKTIEKTNSAVEDNQSSENNDKPILRRRTFPFARRRSFEQQPAKDQVSVNPVQNLNNDIQTKQPIMDGDTQKPSSDNISNGTHSESLEAPVVQRKRVTRTRATTPRLKTTENNDNYENDE